MGYEKYTTGFTPTTKYTTGFAPTIRGCLRGIVVLLQLTKALLKMNTSLIPGSTAVSVWSETKLVYQCVISDSKV